MPLYIYIYMFGIFIWILVHSILNYHQCFCHVTYTLHYMYTTRYFSMQNCCISFFLIVYLWGMNKNTNTLYVSGLLYCGNFLQATALFVYYTPPDDWSNICWCVKKCWKISFLLNLFLISVGVTPNSSVFFFLFV
jgi:hypothetical protein